VDSDANPAHEARPAALVDWPVDARAPRCVAFVVNGRRVPPSLIGLHAAEADANAREELNALYVAMTRARHTLVFSRTVPRSAAATPSWWSRIRDATQELGIAAIESPAAPVAVSQAMVAESLRPVPSGASIERADHEAAGSDEARRLGQAVHRTLQWHAQVGVPDSDLTTLAASAAREFGLAGAVARCVFDIVSAMLGSPKLAALFDPGRVLWSANEIEVAHAGEVLRIDRLVQIGPADNPAWWVLDYKLDANAVMDPELRRQLARYRDAVRGLVGPTPVHAAFATRDGQLHELN
jgi:ATP-dependent helicase/nuclease subunit A